MKILIDARLYGPENAGLGRYVTNLIEQFSKTDTKDNFIVLLRKKYYESLVFPSNWKKVLADYRHYSFAEQIKLPAVINKENPDVTHFPHFNVPILFKGKYVVTIHDMLMHKSVGKSATTLSAPIYLIKRIGYKYVFKNAVRKAKLVIVPTNTIKKELIKEYKLNVDKVIVTYEGFDEKIKNSMSKVVDGKYFVYAGNAYPHKNLISLIKAINILDTKYNQKVFLAIASARNIFTQRMEILVQKLSMKSYVKILGFVPDEKLGSLFRNSEGFVFPSVSEGFGLPGLEAMASGTLLLASNIDVFKEVYRDNAIYFDPQSPESIAEAMNKTILMSKDERKKRIEKSEKFVKIYSWDKMAKETLGVYEKALPQK